MADVGLFGEGWEKLRGQAPMDEFCEGCGEEKLYRGQTAGSFVCCRDCWRKLPKWLRDAFLVSHEYRVPPDNLGATVWETRLREYLRWMAEARKFEEERTDIAEIREVVARLLDRLESEGNHMAKRAGFEKDPNEEPGLTDTYAAARRALAEQGRGIVAAARALYDDYHAADLMPRSDKDSDRLRVLLWHISPPSDDMEDAYQRHGLES